MISLLPLSISQQSTKHRSTPLGMPYQSALETTDTVQDTQYAFATAHVNKERSKQSPQAPGIGGRHGQSYSSETAGYIQ
jgi:hypothetical protein